MQGVFFRESCRQRAAAEGVAGYVGNRRDGRVEAAFEGDKAAVEHMVAWCREGPPAARVDNLEVHPEEPEGLTSFRVASLRS